jgi:hypothetical protein
MPKTPSLRAHQIRSLHRLADAINSSTAQTGRSAIVLDDMQVQVHEKEEEPRIIFNQTEADGIVSAMLTAMSILMKGMKTELPLPHIDSVGALAVYELEAFVATGNTAADDFVAVAAGVMRLHAWTCLLASLRGELEPRSLTYWRSGLKLTPQSERLLPMVMPTANLALGLPMGSKLTDLVFAMIKEWKEMDAEGKMVPVGARASAFVLAHEVGHWACGHGDQYRRSRGGFSSEDYHRVEFEADAFAVHHFRPLVGGGSKLASEVWPLFALLAVAPRCLEAYPDIADVRTHPHPLKRLSRVLAACCPENRIEQDAYVDAAVDIIDVALATVGKRLLSHDVSLRDIRALAGHSGQSEV